jgi:hypothetical protein
VAQKQGSKMIWQWRVSAFSKDSKTKTAVVRLYADYPLSDAPPRERIDVQLVVPWSEDRTEKEQILAVLSKLQILIGKEIRGLSGMPDDAL